MSAMQKPDAAREPFRMPIDAVRVIPGRGTVVAGTIAAGSVTEGDPVQVAADGGTPVRPTTVTKVLIGGRVVNGPGRAGDTVELLLYRIDPKYAPAGAVLRAR